MYNKRKLLRKPPEAGIRAESCLMEQGGDFQKDGQISGKGERRYDDNGGSIGNRDPNYRQHYRRRRECLFALCLILENWNHDLLRK